MTGDRSAKSGVVVFKASMFNEGGRSASRSAKFGVAVFQASMLDWLGGQSAMGISALCYIYMKLIWCNGFFKDLCSIVGGGSIYHGYICNMLYMKHIWCNGVPEIYAWLEEGVGSICRGFMCNLLYIYETYLV